MTKVMRREDIMIDENFKITDQMRQFRTVIVHGVSTVGKSWLDKDKDCKNRMLEIGVDTWDTDALPKFLFGSYRAAGVLQGPKDPERSDVCAEAFGELMERRIGYVKDSSSTMLVFTNNISLVRQWRELTLCSFTRSRADTLLLRMEREGLSRATLDRLMKDWVFELPPELNVPSVKLKRGEFLSNHIGLLATWLNRLRTGEVKEGTNLC